MNQTTTKRKRIKSFLPNGNSKLHGERVKELRIKRSLFQTQLAAKANISQGYLAKIEQGKRDMLTNTMDSILEALNVSFFEFYDNWRFK